jgi:uncharacterized membrane protein YozB (DUF420 family)
MTAGAALITLASLVYFDFESLPPFAIEKFPLRFEALWLASLRVHVASALLTFPLCLALMTRPLQRRAAWHRWVGRVAATFILFALVPSGFVLAFDAKGGRFVTLGFLLSGGIIAAALVAGVRAARRRDLVSHRNAMRHVVAQMSVAVTSRAMIMASDTFGMDPGTSYVIALWVPVVASFATAELVNRRAWSKGPSLAAVFARSRRESLPQAQLVRVRAAVPPVARLGR